MSRATIIILTALVFIGVNIGRAQDTSISYLPKAVLVQLRSEHRRIEAATKARMHKELEEVTKDALAEQAAMINDFQDHFTDCPVYYYMDTNADLIQKKVFKGILLNAGLVPVENLPIRDTDTNYLVVYYGYPVQQSAIKKMAPDTTYRIVFPEAPENSYKSMRLPDTMRNKHNSGEPEGIGLIVLNDKFKQVNYFYKFGYDEFFLNRHIDKKYRYTSKHYEIEYYPFASLFNQKLTDRGGNHRIPGHLKNKKEPE